MKPFIIIVVVIAAVVIAMMVGSGLVSKIHKEDGMTGDAVTSLENRGDDIKQLNKQIEAQQERDYQEKRHSEDYERLDSSSADSKMDVPEFRDEETAPSTISSLYKSLSQWQSWALLATIVVGGWIVWRRITPPKA